MSTIFGKLTSGVPRRIDSNALDETLRNTIGEGIGWSVAYDAEMKPTAIAFEYPTELAYDPKAIEDVFSAHVLSEDAPDDFQKSAKDAERKQSQADKLSEIIERWDSLISEVEALKARK